MSFAMSEKAEGKSESSNSHQVKAEKLDGPPSPKRIKITDNVNDLKKSSREYLISKFQEQDKYIDYLEEKIQRTSNAGELTSLRESEEKLKLQQQESTRRENVLVMRLATKEQEMQELLTQIHDLKQAQNPAGAQLRSTLLDPAVNIVFQRMKSELDETKDKLEQAQNDLSAWKFTPDSVTGKKLMAKCRMLIQENSELGGRLSKGRVAQLEAELALQKKYSEELTTSEDELREFVIQLDEEVEGMQSTILTLQRQLKCAKNELMEEKKSGEKQTEQIRILEQNLDHARTQPPSPEEGGKPSVEDMQCHTDRTETDSQESGPENMETECSNEEPREDNVKPEVKDLNLPILGTDEENVKLDLAGSVSPGYKNVSSEEENAQHVGKNVITGVNNVFPKVRDVSPEVENEKFKTNNAVPVVENVTFGSENVRCEAEKAHLDVENAKSNRQNAKSNTENETSNAENAKSNTEDVPSRTVEKVSPFGSPNVRKSAGTPPCPTTFSISQILGEPKRTPSPISDVTGGDAVVTKIPYIGGYTDPTVEDNALRTEGSGLLNGETKDGTQPVIT